VKTVVITLPPRLGILLTEFTTEVATRVLSLSTRTLRVFQKNSKRKVSVKVSEGPSVVNRQCHCLLLENNAFSEHYGIFPREKPSENN
jgi:hypothetical protein